MADKTINVRLKQRYDTETNWSSKNPVLLAGEMAISSDKNGKYKVGNGTAKWSELAYAKANLEKADVTTALGYTPPTTDTTYSDATQATHGLMTAADKKKLDGIASGATAVTDSTVSNWGYKKTDTWRGIQNNLTSTSATDSLSAAQGKVLKGLVDSKTSNKGTVTGIKMNGITKGTSGIVDLGTVLTSGSQTSITSADGGSNVYTFSDGSTIKVKNGSTGTPGKDGVTPTIEVASGPSINSVGTPSVTARTSGTTTTFTFNYLKGKKGDKGDPGVNATTTAVATTSANGLMSYTDKTNHDAMYTALSDEITQEMVNSLF